MPGATYTEMLLRWKIMLYLLGHVKVEEKEVKPKNNQAVTKERRLESCPE